MHALTRQFRVQFLPTSMPCLWCQPNWSHWFIEVWQKTINSYKSMVLITGWLISAWTNWHILFVLWEQWEPLLQMLHMAHCCKLRPASNVQYMTWGCYPPSSAFKEGSLLRTLLIHRAFPPIEQINAWLGINYLWGILSWVTISGIASVNFFHPSFTLEISQPGHAIMQISWPIVLFYLRTQRIPRAALNLYCTHFMPYQCSHGITAQGEGQIVCQRWTHLKKSMGAVRTEERSQMGRCIKCVTFNHKWDTCVLEVGRKSSLQWRRLEELAYQGMAGHKLPGSRALFWKQGAVWLH